MAGLGPSGKGDCVKTAIVTGAAGLIGSESVRFLAGKGFRVIGIDNDMRRYFFGDAASTKWMLDVLKAEVPGFENHDLDIRDEQKMFSLFAEYSSDVDLVLHTASQPSHDWAAREPITDFTVNANGTLNLLEATRKYCPEAVFIFTSTNKVYGDTPNALPLQDLERRLELPEDHPWFDGIDTSMSIDRSTHSLFGVSKAAADLLVQEYGRYFDLPTVCFRCGCITGPAHAGAMLHGFLAYLMKCVVTGTPYTVFGYEGKQVRDNIDGSDLVEAFLEFHRAPRSAAVYNMGGGRESNCSMLEAIEACERIAGRELDWELSPDARIGDHRWWVSDLGEFQSDYPNWKLTQGIESILQQIHDVNAERWVTTPA
jgi:CDP-paratose 2-epimerase